MADFWRTWEQFRRKSEAVKYAETLQLPEHRPGGRVTRIEPGESGYRDGFRWAVEVDRGEVPAS